MLVKKSNSHTAKRNVFTEMCSKDGKRSYMASKCSATFSVQLTDRIDLQGPPTQSKQIDSDRIPLKRALQRWLSSFNNVRLMQKDFKSCSNPSMVMLVPVRSTWDRLLRFIPSLHFEVSVDSSWSSSVLFFLAALTIWNPMRICRDNQKICLTNLPCTFPVGRWTPQ